MPTQSNPAEQLWRAYPLEQTATTSSGRTPPPRTVNTRASSEPSAQQSGHDTPWLALLLTGAAAAFSIATLLVLRREPVTSWRVARRAGRAPPAGAAAAAASGAAQAAPSEPETSPAPTPAKKAPATVEAAAATPPRGADASPDPKAPSEGSRAPRTPGATRPDPESPPPARQPPTQARPQPSTPPPTRPERRAEQRSKARPPAVEPRDRKPSRAGASRRAPSSARPRASGDARAAAGAARPGRSSPAAAERGSAGAGASQEQASARPIARGAICEIRWLPKGRGSCFAAVTTDDNGVERTLATSPRIEWRAAAPPEQSAEAQTALRQLSKTLRNNGWRPMRAKGKDFNEPQWYARRFRHPEATPDTAPATGERGASTR